jgi:hypothetical protein
VLDVIQLARLQRDLGGSTTVEAILGEFVDRLSGRLHDLDESLRSGHAGGIDHACLALTEPASHLGMVALHRSLVHLRAASQLPEPQHTVRFLRLVHGHATTTSVAVREWLDTRPGHAFGGDVVAGFS